MLKISFSLVFQTETEESNGHNFLVIGTCIFRLVVCQILAILSFSLYTSLMSDEIRNRKAEVKY